MNIEIGVRLFDQSRHTKKPFYQNKIDHHLDQLPNPKFMVRKLLRFLPPDILPYNIQADITVLVDGKAQHSKFGNIIADNLLLELEILVADILLLVYFSTAKSLKEVINNITVEKEM